MNHAAPGEHPSRDAGHRSPEELLVRVATGDEAAFQQLYAVVAGPVFGLVRRVVRDAAQSKEVTQEVLVELWRTASRYHPDRGGALTWVLTMAHRRAVDRVRCTQGRTDLEQRAATRVADRAFDEVSSEPASRLWPRVWRYPKHRETSSTTTLESTVDEALELGCQLIVKSIWWKDA